MSEVTVGSLAKVLGMPTEKLLEQLAGAGMSFSGPDQVVSSTEKMKLLGFLRRTHGKDDKPAEVAAPRKITLQRRKQEELTVNAGKTRSTVTVEVRQKRTYVKRDEVDAPVTDERDLPALTVSSSCLRRCSVIFFGAATSAGLSSLPCVRRRKPSSFIFSVLLTT